MVKKEGLQKGIKGVIISTTSGVPLVSVKVDNDINEGLIAPFFSALHNFSDENLGAMNESLIQGGVLDMLVSKKHGLILIAIMDKEMKKVQIGVEAEQALDLFYEMFRETIEQIDEGCVDVSVFNEFCILLKNQIDEYYCKTEHKGSLFSKLFNSFKKKQGEIR